MALHLATEEQQKQILAELKTTHEQLNRDVIYLKRWLKLQPHLPQCTTDTNIAAFILGSKNNLELAKKKIDSYYTVRTTIPELFTKRDPQDNAFKESAESLLVAPLPKLTPDGCRVTMAGFRIPGPNKYDVITLVKRILSIADIRFQQEVFTNGDYLIIDGNRFSLAHALCLTPSLVRQVVFCSQEVYPLRIKGIIYFNVSYIVNAVVKFAKPFLRSKHFDRMTLYSEDHHVLLNHFPKEMLPRDYGGEETPLIELSSLWMKRLEAERGWLLGDGMQKVDEEKRPKGNKTNKVVDDLKTSDGLQNLNLD
uniref:CRAL-TRIO domain-containing protein n=1 Tax=Clastoptera arizonana TaxID=38151 RepID=A0A1B6E704_9HEMI